MYWGIFYYPITLEWYNGFMNKVDLVRLLIADVSIPSQIFSDEQLEGFLEIHEQNIKRAAASAIRAIAIDEALLRDIKTDDLQVTGSSVASALRNIAAQLDMQADADDRRDAEEFFMVVFPEQYEVPELHQRPWEWGF